MAITHPLIKTVGRIRRRAQWLVLLIVFLRIAFVGLGLLLLVSLIDWIMRFQAKEPRILLSSLALVLFLLCVVRFLPSLMALRLGNLDVAIEIERCFPKLADKLSSSIDFLSRSDNDIGAGSQRLRQAVVSQTVKEIASIPVQSVLNSSPLRRLSVASSIMLFALVLFALIDPRSAGTTLARAVMPWSDIHWPRDHVLRIEALPETIAIGADLPVKVTDQNGRMPKSVNLIVKLDDGRQFELGQAVERDVNQHVYRIDNVQQSLRLRAVGGDDRSMAWHRVAVAQPPRIDDIELVLVPPEYTGWTNRHENHSFHALEGTSISVRGRSTRPLELARIHLKTKSGEDAFELSVSKDGFTFSSDGGDPEWIVSESGTYWIELVDYQGLRGGLNDRWELRSVQDEAPTATIALKGSRGLATPAAVLPLRVSASDDLNVREIELNAMANNGTRILSKTIYKSTSEETGVSQEDRLGGLAKQQRIVELEVDLEETTSLQPGTMLALTATTVDSKPQCGSSNGPTVEIVSESRYLAAAADRLVAIIDQLTKLVNRQTLLVNESQRLHAMIENPLRNENSSASALRRLLQSQQEIRSRLILSNDSIDSKVRGLHADLARNRLGNGELTSQLDHFIAVIKSVDEQQLTGAEQLLSKARAALAEAETNARDVAPDLETATEALPRDTRSAQRHLASASQQQQIAINAMRQLIFSLSRAASVQQFVELFDRIRLRQRELFERVQSAVASEFAAETTDSAVDNRRLTRTATTSQEEIAHSFARAIDQLSELRRVGTAKEQESAKMRQLSQAVATESRMAIRGEMREAVNALTASELGRALDHQRAIDSGLTELLRILTADSGNDAYQLDQLRSAARRLQRLIDDMGLYRESVLDSLGSRDDSQQIATATESKRRLETLASNTRDVASNLAHLNATKASRHVTQAAEALHVAARNVASKVDEVKDSFGQAKSHLQNAMDVLTERIPNLQRQIESNQVARISRSLQELIARQNQVHQSTRRLDDALRTDNGSRASERESFAQLARDQRQLSADIDALSSSVDVSGIFRMSFSNARGDMMRAAALLERLSAGDRTQRAQLQAKSRLIQMVESLKFGLPRFAQDDNNGDSGQASQDAAGRTELNARLGLAELELLRQIQASIHDRSKEIESKRNSEGRLSETDQYELSQLAREQKRLIGVISDSTIDQPTNDRGSTGVNEPTDTSLDQLLLGN